MLKYSIKCFDDKENLVMSAVIPAEQLFDFLDKYRKDFIVKAYLMTDEQN